MLAKRRLFDTRLLRFLHKRGISLKAKELRSLSDNLNHYVEKFAYSEGNEALASEMVEFVLANGDKLKGISPIDSEAMTAFKGISSKVSSSGHLCFKGSERRLCSNELRRVLLHAQHPF